MIAPVESNSSNGQKRATDKFPVGTDEQGHTSVPAHRQRKTSARENLSRVCRFQRLHIQCIRQGQIGLTSLALPSKERGDIPEESGWSDPEREGAPTSTSPHSPYQAYSSPIFPIRSVPEHDASVNRSRSATLTTTSLFGQACAKHTKT